jgi:hypothetical protein
VTKSTRPVAGNGCPATRSEQIAIGEDMRARRGLRQWQDTKWN